MVTLRGRFWNLSTIKCLLLALLLLALALQLNITPLLDRRKGFVSSRHVVNADQLPKGYSIYMPRCKMRELDPLPEELKGIIKHTGDYSCPGPLPLEERRGSQLRLNKKQVLDTERRRGGKVSCLYDSIIRAKNDTYQIVALNQRLTMSYQRVKHEFIVVTCRINNTKIFYQNFLAFTPRKDPAHIPPDPTFKPNVVMIGIDSVSRYNMMRKLKRTYRLLRQKSNVIEFRGHNKVADNTFVNLIPMFTGKFVGEVWKYSQRNQSFDHLPLIWRNFSEAGYLTLYQEDVPRINTFNYLKRGFDAPPTDYYMRPFIMAANDKDSYMASHSSKRCYNNKTEVEVMLSYVLDFLNVVPKTPKFVFSMTNSFSHDDVNDIGYLDDFYHRFFYRFCRSKSFNNSFVFFLSDHGIRFGKIRETYIGQLEERLPMLLVMCPPWFRSKYPNLWQNLASNARSLTTHFDIYWTLVDLLRYPDLGALQYPDKAKGQSLFAKVNVNRSCETEHILPHWCVCEEKAQVSVTDPTTMRAAHFIVEQVNSKVRELKQCVRLTLSSVRSAYRTAVNRRVLEKVNSKNEGTHAPEISDYLIALLAEPGSAIFEATVRFDEANNKMKLVGEISRINEYGSSADCVAKYVFQKGVHDLVKFCFCGD